MGFSPGGLKFVYKAGWRQTAYLAGLRTALGLLLGAVFWLAVRPLADEPIIARLRSETVIRDYNLGKVLCALDSPFGCGMF